MIETRYPGVYLTEVPFAAKPIEGVSTTTSNLTGASMLERFAGMPGLADRARDAARVAAPDPDFKYVNVRRYLLFLEQSIDKALQFAVFEPNGEALWANVRATVADFLFGQWQSGALVGTRPEDAFFVKCDRSTMTQDDLDNGRLVVLIGVATVRPAEFVILRIGSWTASSGA